MILIINFCEYYIITIHEMPVYHNRLCEFNMHDYNLKIFIKGKKKAEGTGGHIQKS